MKTYIYNNWLVPGKWLWWTTCGWSDSRANARAYRTEAEAEEPLRRMLANGEKALPISL